MHFPPLTNVTGVCAPFFFFLTLFLSFCLLVLSTFTSVFILSFPAYLVVYVSLKALEYEGKISRLWDCGVAK